MFNSTDCAEDAERRDFSHQTLNLRIGVVEVKLLSQIGFRR